MGDLIGTMKNSIPRKFWGLDSGQRGQFYLISELNDEEQTIPIAQHRVGERSVLCSGDGCPACVQGVDQIKVFAVTFFVPDQNKKIAALLRFGKQGVLKKLVGRYEILKEQNGGAAPSMRGDLFVAERASDGFSYDLQYLGSHPDKVKDIVPFTRAEVVAKLKASDRGN